MNEYFDTIEVKRFFKFATVAVALLGLFLIAESLNALKDWQTPSTAQSTIVVSGMGEAYVTPDIATFNFTVSADAATVSAGQDTVTGKTNTILAALKALNIADADIQTSNYSVYPKYTYNRNNQIPDGYTVSHSITVKVHNVDDAGKALAAASDNGATNISGLSFTEDNPSTTQADARDKAIADAKQKALVLAKSLGVSLGRVVDFSEGQSSPVPYPIMYAATSAGSAVGAPTLPVGQNKVTDNVSITYEIR